MGYSYMPGDTAIHAFLWDSVDSLFDLNDLVVDLTGWDYLEHAFSISDTGFITGYGITTNGETHAFLLTPESPQLPEPTSIALLGLGLGVFVGLSRKRGQPQ